MASARRCQLLTRCLSTGAANLQRVTAHQRGCLKKTKCQNRRTVIANQSADWCGNPPDFQTSTLGNLGFYAYPGDCHTSDIGHWFAMTRFFDSLRAAANTCSSPSFLYRHLDICPHPSRLRRATYTLLCNCHWQLLDFDSLRGAPPRRGRLWKTDCDQREPHQSAASSQ